VASTEANYSVTFKTPRGNLVTVRGDDSAQFVSNLDDAAKSGALGVIKQIEDTLAGQPKASAAPAAAPAADPAVPATAAAPSNPASQGDQQLPAGMGEPACETCGGPTRFDKEGRSQKSGLPYRRYLCTTNQLHRATFA
jgi:hypothetical protein